ncbi:MAG: helix-turn-helix transcriptional regulator [Lentisphaeria bacterium]|nr:helix-turn-helix transcriptional regulator [Lentisphaeria bacterium]
MAEASAGSTFPEPANDIVFDGHITPDLARLLRQKRKSLDLSLRELSPLLGISWSTLQKWETGQINTCRPQHGVILTSFVTGKLDAHLPSAKPSANAPAFTPDQSVLLYVQTKNNRAVIAFPASSSTACAHAFQSVFNYINDQLQAIHNTAQQPQTIARPGQNTPKPPAKTAKTPPPPAPAGPNPPLAAAGKNSYKSQ